MGANYIHNSYLKCNLSVEPRSKDIRHAIRLAACAKIIELESKIAAYLNLFPTIISFLGAPTLCSAGTQMAFDYYEDLSGDCLPNNNCIMILLGWYCGFEIESVLRLKIELFVRKAMLVIVYWVWVNAIYNSHFLVVLWPSKVFSSTRNYLAEK